MKLNFVNLFTFFRWSLIKTHFIAPFKIANATGIQSSIPSMGVVVLMVDKIGFMSFFPQGSSVFSFLFHLHTTILCLPHSFSFP